MREGWWSQFRKMPLLRKDNIGLDINDIRIYLNDLRMDINDLRVDT